MIYLHRDRLKGEENATWGLIYWAAKAGTKPPYPFNRSKLSFSDVLWLSYWSCFSSGLDSGSASGAEHSRYLTSGGKSADGAGAQFGYVRTLDGQAGFMGEWTYLGPQLWEGEGKAVWLPPCMSLPQQHPAAQPSSVLASPCSHPPPAVGVSTAHPSTWGQCSSILCSLLENLEQIWIGNGCAKIKAGHKHLSDSTSTSVYLKPKASGTQSVMNYFFVSGLTTHVTSAVNPSSINSWVKMPCVLILYVLCISSITVYSAAVMFIAIYMPSVFSIFSPQRVLWQLR